MSKLLKEQQVIVRFGSGEVRQKVNVGRTLKAVRGILLNGYAATGVNAAPIVHLIRVEEMSSAQLKSFAQPGYAIPLCKAGGPVADLGNIVVNYDKPRELSNHAVGSVTALNFTVSTSTGAAPVYTELMLDLTLVYEDDRLDLLPRELTEPVNAMTNYNERPQSELEREAAIHAAQRAVFSRLASGK